MFKANEYEYYQDNTTVVIKSSEEMKGIRQLYENMHCALHSVYHLVMMLYY